MPKNIFKKLFRMLSKECGGCCLSREERGREGGCGRGCVLYGSMGRTGIACILPNMLLRPVKARKDAEYDAAMARESKAVAAWYRSEEAKDNLFLRALKECLFVDGSGAPAVPLYRSPNGNYYPYEPTDRWHKARADYEQNLADGLPEEKAFQKAIAEYLAPELYYGAGNGRYETFRVFANCPRARARYTELLGQAGGRKSRTGDCGERPYEGRTSQD